MNDFLQFSFKNGINFVKTTCKEDGFKSLWRGNTAAISRVIPLSTISFSSHEQFKKLFGADLEKNQKSWRPLRNFLAGAAAGFTGQSVVYPLDVARARMAVTNKTKYQNLFQVFHQIIQREGTVLPFF